MEENPYEPPEAIEPTKGDRDKVFSRAIFWTVAIAFTLVALFIALATVCMINVMSYRWPPGP